MVFDFLLLLENPETDTGLARVSRVITQSLSEMNLSFVILSLDPFEIRREFSSKRFLNGGIVYTNLKEYLSYLQEFQFRNLLINVNPYVLIPDFEKIFALKQKKFFKLWGYLALEESISKEKLKPILSNFDYKFCYLEKDINLGFQKAIPNPSSPLLDERRIEKDIDILIVSSNRLRKDLIRSFEILIELEKRFPSLKSVLVSNSLYSELRLFEYFKQLKNIRFYQFPINQELLSYLYKSSRFVLSTSLAEGWGYSFFEGIQNDCFPIAPLNSSFLEFEKKGFNFVKLELSDEKAPTYYGFEKRVALKESVEKISYYLERPIKEEYLRKNKELIKQYSWDKVLEIWKETFKNGV